MFYYKDNVHHDLDRQNEVLPFFSLDVLEINKFILLELQLF